MKVRILIILVLCLVSFIFAEVSAQHISGLDRRALPSHSGGRFEQMKESAESARVYLCRALGKLTVDICATSEIYEAYFHIPISFAEQVPIIVEVESPQLIDYRFLSLEPPNMVVAARLRRALETTLDWEVWVLVRENLYDDLPSEVPLASVEELPDSVSRWLQPTDCVQMEAPIVQNTADALGEGVTDLLALADTIRSYCQNLPGDMSHYPISFDAVYALNWGSSCTGHAHVGAALFRALGVPARCLLVMPTWAQYWYDMHWIIEIYVPQYGWVKLETTIGQFPCFPMDNIVVLACHPEDEFPLFYPSGIEGYWHSSDPTLGTFNPSWGQAHRVLPYNDFEASAERIEYAHALTDSVFQLYSQFWGIGLSDGDQAHVHSACDLQSGAVDRLKADDLEGYIADMQEALQHYRSVGTEPLTTVFFDNFESGPNGWTHGGIHDEWELGRPVLGPAEPYSGDHCWGTDLDGLYENEADNWLSSPPIDLSGLACAQLNFWVWNWVQDEGQGFVYDPLWMDITTDGNTFEYLCSYMGGVNDDPLIPDVGGWTNMVLDLAPYVGDTVRFRFHFESDAEEVQFGAYIDDVHVKGRVAGQTEVEWTKEAASVKAFELLGNYPNPFNDEMTITFRTDEDVQIQLDIYNIFGQKVKTLIDGPVRSGQHQVTWRGEDQSGAKVSSGIYLYLIQTKGMSRTGKILLLR